MKHCRPHLLVALLLSVLVLSGLHASLRESLLDARFKWLTRPASGNIVLVEIDPRSIDAVGHWPWPRSMHGQLLQRLEKAGATDVVFDVDFSTPSTSDEDAAFADALQAAGGSVVLPAFRQRVADRGDGKTLHVNRPVPLLAQHAWLALVNVLPDRDGVIRGFNHGARIDGEFIASVGGMLAGRHDQSAPPFRIDFGIEAASVPTVSYVDVLSEAPAALAALRGRKVVISGTAAELGDRFTVPNGAIIPGSLVQVLAAESIAQGRALTVTSGVFSLAGVVALMLAMAFAWRRARSGRRVLALGVLALGAEGVAFVVQAHYPIAIDTSLILAGALAYAVVAAIDEIDLRGLLRLNAERRFERIAMSLSDGLICVDQRGRITLWNPGASSIFGHTEQAALGQPFEFLLAQGLGSPGEASSGEPAFVLTSVPLARLQQRGGTVIELVGLRRSGDRFDLECSLSCWETVTGVQYGVVLRDISQRRRQQQHIRYLAECDVVTGLPNRNSLITHLEAAMTRQPAEAITLMLVGVNRFQQVNNLHGHSFGDALVVAVADRLRTFVAQPSLIARLGSDEFAIVLTGEDATGPELGARITADFLARSVLVGERHLRVAVAVGLASARDAGHAEMLVGNARFALAAARSRESAGLVSYDPAMRGAIEQREALETELRTALACNEFELFYQPQIDLRTGAVVGAEALIRWRHRERGYVSPGEFMPVVNTTSLSEEVSAWVLETACRRAGAWQRRGYNVRVGVNMSQSQFASGDLVADVARLLAETELRPELLELEVTEDIILDNSDKTLSVLSELRALGVKIAFDDFGTGYGSLTYLKTFPLDKIKIDQSFVKRLEAGSQDAAIVAATINLGQALGLSVIAEGIETDATAGLLREMGCGEGQGYLISRPIPAKQFEAKFLRNEVRLVA